MFSIICLSVCVSVQGSFVLVVQVFDDDDGNPDDFVDLLVVEQSLTPSPTPTSPTTYTSSAGIFFLELSFRVECSESEKTYQTHAHSA